MGWCKDRLRAGIDSEWTNQNRRLKVVVICKLNSYESYKIYFLIKFKRKLTPKSLRKQLEIIE